MNELINKVIQGDCLLDDIDVENCDAMDEDED